MPLSTKLIRDGYIESQDVVFQIRHKLIEEADDFIRDSQDKTKATEMAAEKILFEARQKAEQIKIDAYNAGYAEGLEKSMLEGRKIVEKAQSNSEELLANIEQYRCNTLEVLKEEIRDLVIGIVEKIIKTELNQGEDLTTNLVKVAIEEVKARKKVHIFINPRDLERVEQEKELLNTKLEMARVEFLTDPLIELGGCRIHTERGWVDATIDNQLKELKDLLLLETG